MTDCIIIHGEQNVCQLIDGMLFEVRFTPSSGTEIFLQCKVIRTHRKEAGDQNSIVGMEIINPPPVYRDFLRAQH